MLLDILLRKSIKTVSIIGMAKNVGKTVTLNHLVNEAAQRGLRLGLSSVGRDGEKTDAVFYIPKPSIYAPAEAVIATAEGCLRNTEAVVEVMQRTGFQTAMGEVILARVREPGKIELAGPTLINQHKAIINRMLELGADMVIMDGALDRISMAAPSVTEGTILATGAALASGMQEVLEKTRERLEQFTLEQVSDPEQLDICSRVINRSKAVLIYDDYMIQILNSKGTLTSGKQICEAIRSDVKGALLSGAVGNDVMKVLVQIVKSRERFELIIKNGACLYCDKLILKKFIELGGIIRVLEPMKVTAVTLNPTAVTGRGFEPQAFFETAKRVLAPYPVMDVILGRTSFKGLEV